MTDLELLRDVAEARRGDDVECHARAIAHARLRAALATAPSRRARRGPSRLRRRGLRAAPLIAVAAAALAVIVAWPRGADVEREAHPSSLPGPGQYFYMRSTVRLDGVLPAIRELWVAPDGTGQIVVDVIDGGTETTELGGMHDRWSTHAGRVSYAELTALPADVNALARYVDEHAFRRPDQAQSQFLMIEDLVGETPATPELSAALFTVAERIPGVETAPADESFGPGATRVSLRVGASRRDLVRDANGVLLADELHDARGLVESMRVQQRAIVDALGARP